MNKKTSVSVIAIARNEEKNIADLLSCLIAQSVKNCDYEYIIVDDHSTDSTAKIISSFCDQHWQIRFLKLPENISGKKNSIEFAVNKSDSELIITTDCDCNMNINWLNSVAETFITTNADMILGTVLIKTKPNDKIFNQLQALEFASLIASSAGAASIGIPIMCNAANLAYKKKVFTENSQNIEHRFASGDDIFLLHSLKNKKNRKIIFLSTKDSIVITKPVLKIKDFFQQRMRWVSKSSGYKDTFAIITSVIVLLMNFLLAIIPIIIIYTHNYFFSIFFLLKWIPDFVILFVFLKHYKQLFLLKWFIPLQIIYPYYITYIVFASLFTSKYWKGRKINCL